MRYPDSPSPFIPSRGLQALAAAQEEINRVVATLAAMDLYRLARNQGIVRLSIPLVNTVDSLGNRFLRHDLYDIVAYGPGGVDLELSSDADQYRYVRELIERSRIADWADRAYSWYLPTEYSGSEFFQYSGSEEPVAGARDEISFRPDKDTRVALTYLRSRPEIWDTFVQYYNLGAATLPDQPE